MDEQNKNLILATVLSFLVIMVWFVVFPPQTPEQATPPAQPPAQTTLSPGETAGAPPAAAPGEAGTAPAAATAETLHESRAKALALTERVAVRTARLTGSISLTGGRIDDLQLKDYRETLDKGSPLVTLLSPALGPSAYYALYGWSPAGDVPADAVPNANTPWQVESGTTLSESSPVTLVWDNGKGLIFHRRIEIDKNFLFTITQSVENNTGAEVRLAPYGIIARHGLPALLVGRLVHEGVVRDVDGVIDEIKFKKMTKAEFDEREAAAVDKVQVTENGWTGFTEKYWMTSLVAEPGQGFTSVSKYTATSDTYQTDMRLPVMSIADGATAQINTRLFAGAKEWEVINAYQQNLGIDKFVDSIDWGWFFFLTKPIFRALHFLHGLIGNMGLAVIGLTIIIKALLFPLAYKSYVSMSKMKKLQPEMAKIKERTGGDRQKLQQEMMALYKKEKVNPAAGCLPILPQIPIFFSLYKVIYVTIELRHAPFFGWIHDLSAPDPTSILNLFGLLPFAPPGPTSVLAIFSIGVFPIIMGITMWMQQKLNPAPTDKTQAMVFAWMPWVFMFMLGRFASGLVIYWVANNTITFLQQYSIMRLQGVKPNVLGNIFRKAPAEGSK